jgi:hypothetical protein
MTALRRKRLKLCPFVLNRVTVGTAKDLVHQAFLKSYVTITRYYLMIAEQD